MHTKKSVVSALLLVLTALIWGVAFVAQSVGGESVGAFTFLASRSWIAGFALLPLVIVHRRRFAPEARAVEDRRALFLAGGLSGAALMVASAFQQLGIAETTVGKSGFITALYIVIVPFFGVFLKKKIPLAAWAGVALACVGMYLLCMKDSFSLSRGDFLVLLCAVCFSVQILVIDAYSQRVDGVSMACIQFFTCAILSTVAMLLIETPTAEGLRAALIPILYAGLFSSGVGYTLQIIAQKHVPVTLASLIMSLESVFSALAGWVLLRQTLSVREISGCALVFSAILVAQFGENLTSLMKARKEGRNG